MNKKNLFLANVLVILFSTAIVSCGDDDDDNSGGGGSSSVKNVSADLKPFIGCLDIVTNNGGTFEFPNYKNAFFFTDKKCRISQNNEGAKILDWNYNPSTKVLSVENILHAQWSITATTDNAWSGFSIWATNQQEYTAQKDTTLTGIVGYLLCDTEWVCDTLRFSVYNNSDAYLSTPGNKYYMLADYEMSNKDTDITTGKSGSKSTFAFDENADAVIMTYTTWLSSGRVRCENEFRLVHPYSYKDAYLDVKISDSRWEGGKQEFSGRFKHPLN